MILNGPPEDPPAHKGACCAACVKGTLSGGGRSAAARGSAAGWRRRRSGFLAGLGDDETVPLSVTLQAVLRAMPACPTGRQLVSIMNGVLEKSSGGGFRMSSGATAQAFAALSDAVNSPASIGIEIPWLPWSDEPTYCAGTRPRDTAQNLIGRLLGNAAADVAVTERQIEVAKEAALELVKPTNYLEAAKKVAIVAGAGVVGLVVLKELVHRVGRAPA